MSKGKFPIVLRIAFDIDGVIIDPVRALFEKYKISLKYEEISQWDFTPLIGIDMKTVMQYFEDLDPEQVKFEVCCSHIMNLIHDPNFHIFFLTDKTPKMLDWTRKVLARAELDEIPIYASSQKEMYCMWDILVEDKGETWEKCIAQKRRCVLIDKPWNRNVSFQGAERYFSVNSFCDKMIADYGSE